MTAHQRNQGKDTIRRISYETTEFAKARAISSAEYYKRLLTGQIEGLSKALKITSNNLQSQEQMAMSQISDRAASGLDRMCGRVSEKDVPEVLNDIDQFAKRNPTLFVFGAMGIGFLLSRMLKWAYEEERYMSGEIDHPEMPGASHETH